MARPVLPDTTPLSLLCHPNPTLEDARAIRLWLRRQTEAGVEVLVPEIADYELRRELLRVRRTTSIGRLDSLREELGFLPISSATIRRAAELWALARQRGQVTAPPEALDGDVILAAQAEQVGAIVATENPSHLAWFVPARRWRELPPPI